MAGPGAFDPFVPLSLLVLLRVAEVKYPPLLSSWQSLPVGSLDLIHFASGRKLGEPFQHGAQISLLVW